MLLHLIIVAALLSTGSHGGRVTGSHAALVYRIPADAQASRLSTRARSARPSVERSAGAETQATPQHRFSLTTQLRR